MLAQPQSPAPLDPSLARVTPQPDDPIEQIELSISFVVTR
jgi:hypothetical protein